MTARRYGIWVRNDYTDLRDRLLGPDDDPQDGGLFPSGWTPESETEKHQDQLNRPVADIEAAA